MIERIPILIGALGHIDIPEQNIPELKNQVRTILEKVQKKYPNSPLAIFSPLAECADRIIAQVALEYNAKLIVPLPMPKEIYIKDFTNDASMNEFKELCSKAEQIFTLPLVEGNTLDNISDYGSERDKQYEQVGLYLIKNCQFLIALWDGIDLNKTGGTSNTVKFALNGFVDDYNNALFDAPYSCPVYHILTPRKQHKDFAVEIKAEFLYPSIYSDEKTNKKTLEDIFKKTDSLNRGIVKYFLKDKFKYSVEVKKSQSYILDESAIEALHPFDSNLLEYYSVFDVLSGIYQKYTKIVLISLVLLALLAIIAFEMYAHSAYNSNFLISSVTFLAIGFIIFEISNKRDWQGKYLDYRAVAEGLRIQFFWRLGGVNEDISNYYLSKQKTELKWIRGIIQYINLGINSNNINENVALDNKVYDYNLVIKNWIEDQFKFFNNKAKHNKKLKELFEKLARRSLLLSIVSYAMLIFIHFTQDTLILFCHRYLEAKYIHLGHLFMNILKNEAGIILLAMLPALAAAFEFYSQKMAYQAQKVRYLKAEVLFRRAINHINELVKSNNIDEIKQTIKKLGEESLLENGDWFAIHRERPIEMPNLK